MTPIALNAPIVMQHPKNMRNWILCAPFRYPGGEVPRGFVTDFASIPRLFWNIISPMELGDVGPIKHDWTYRNGFGTRKEADKVFLADMKADGVGWWKRTTAYNLVRAFGGGSWNSGKIVIEELDPVGWGLLPFMAPVAQ